MAGGHAAQLVRTVHFVNPVPWSARHSRQVIRIVKEQDSSNDKSRGTKKAPVARANRGFPYPWSDGSIRTAFRLIVRQAI